MAAATVAEQNTNENIESRFINDDPKLAEMFPEELKGWHGLVNIQKPYSFFRFILFFFLVIVTLNGKNILIVANKQMKF
jgi:hypothetical protein